MIGAVRKSLLEFGLILALSGTSTWLMACASPSQQQGTAKKSSVKGFLQNYLRIEGLNDHQTTRYLDALVDLNGDGKKEVLVYITGREWCGSGGCPTLVLAEEGASYRVITKITITRPPIKVLRSALNGWRTLTVWVQGGSLQPRYEAELQFDGVTYPSNPTVAPARRFNDSIPGETAIPSTANNIEIGKPLYP